MNNSNKFFFLILTAMTLLSNQIFPQVPDTMWTRTFGGTNIDVGYCVQQTADIGYIISGYTRSSGTMSGRNVWLIKTDKDGNEQWNNTFGGNDDDEGYSVQQTNDGGYIIVGYTKSYGLGDTDVFLIKADSIGNPLWIRTFGGSSDDEGYSVQQTADGNYIIGGVTSSYGAGSRDAWLIKTNSSGNMIWQKTHGGMSSDGAWSVQQTIEGGYILTGWTYSFGPGFLGNVWLVKTDSLGDQQWNNFFGGADVDRGYSVQQTADRGYIITGYTDSFGAGLYDVLLIKTNSLGAEEWTKTFGGSGRDYGNWVQQTLDGGYIVVGYTLSFGAGGDDVYLIKTDMNGNEEWSTTYGGAYSDVGYCVRQTIDGGYIVTGHTLSFGAGVHDVWLIKLNIAVPVELISFNGEAVDGNVLLSWVTASELNNLGFEIEKALGSSSSFYKNWESIGFVKGKGTSTEVNEYSFIDDNIKSPKNNYRLKQIDFDGNYNYSDEVVIENEILNYYSLEQNYPNPFNPNTVIKFSLPEDATHVRLTIYSTLGEKITELVNTSLQAGQYTYQWNASDVAAGIYIYELKTEKFNAIKKMVFMK